VSHFIHICCVRANWFLNKLSDTHIHGSLHVIKACSLPLYISHHFYSILFSCTLFVLCRKAMKDMRVSVIFSLTSFIIVSY